MPLSLDQTDVNVCGTDADVQEGTSPQISPLWTDDTITNKMNELLVQFSDSDFSSIDSLSSMVDVHKRIHGTVDPKNFEKCVRVYRTGAADRHRRWN